MLEVIKPATLIDISIFVVVQPLASLVVLEEPREYIPVEEGQFA